LSDWKESRKSALMDDHGPVAVSCASTERGDVSSLESSEHGDARSDAEQLEMPSVVRLNVGGMMFSTTVDTLTQRDTYSMLAVMFSGRHRLHMDSKKGAVFIDRDGTHFRHILNW
jgi:hypothetical protein